jgi:hypothetical protein
MIPSVEIAMLLAPGDRMELEEFLERWEQLPELKFAELIDAVFYMPFFPLRSTWASRQLGSFCCPLLRGSL